MKNRNLLDTVMLTGVFLFMCGCETLDSDSKSKEPSYVMTINEIVKYPRANSLEKEVPTYSGSTRYINTNPFIHSRNVMEIEMIPSAQKKGFYDLQLKLDYHGKLAWLQLSVNYAYGELGFLIDGVYYRSITPDKIASEYEDSVLLRGPFDPVTAKSLKANSIKNYKFYNGEPKDKESPF
ncbi:MAG: hypothetical protein WAX69_16620 [Victivallales bacterium]